jgi:multicomponent Na+:H+ antiporter subunit E
LHLLGAIFVLFAFWLLLSGHYAPFLVTAGFVCALAVTLFARRMAMLDREGHPLHLAPRALLVYWPWLLKEIVKSGWAVSKLILHPRLPISPTVISVRCTQKTDVGRVVFANSITLTPGTISLEVGRDEILVHALTRAGAQELAGGDMDRRVTAFEQAP